MKVCIIMGSDSDLPVMKDAAKFLVDMGIPYEITVISAHRAPKRLFEYAEKARDNGFSVVIAGAGGSAHLPGVIAALTTLPVIGVPIDSNCLNGIDALYSIVQMPAGIPVATVAINGAKNAAILAASILSVSDKALADKLQAFKDNMRDTVIAKGEKLKSEGYSKYLSDCC